MITNLARLECDRCGKDVLINVQDKNEVEKAEHWISVRRQYKDSTEEFQVCSGACLAKLAEAVMQEALEK